jgi:Smg protein
MFEVLVYVYENYWHGNACPEPNRLSRKLTAAGFEAEEINDALVWLDGLNAAAQSTRLAEPPTAPLTPVEENFPSSASVAATPAPSPALLPCTQSPDSLRVYSVAEQVQLGAQCLGFICFLEGAGVLPPPMREIVIDRALAAPGEPVALDDLKIIVLMVYWSLGHQPEALVLDELCEDAAFRVAH